MCCSCIIAAISRNASGKFVAEAAIGNGSPLLPLENLGKFRAAFHMGTTRLGDEFLFRPKVSKLCLCAVLYLKLDPKSCELESNDSPMEENQINRDVEKQGTERTVEYDAFLKSIAEVGKKRFATAGPWEALADLQRRMVAERVPVYGGAILEAARAARSMEETLALSLEKLGIPSLAEHTKLNELAVRMASGPMAELQQSGILAVFANQPRIEAMQQVMANFEAHFRLPDFTEAARLVEGFQSRLAGSLSTYAVDISDLKRAMRNMRSPWLNLAEEARSVAGFAEVQGIGRAVANLQSFGDNLAATLRTSLGDWREPITWRPEVLADLQARSDFYIGLGFNPDVTAFPLRAFEQTLDVAGLRRAVLPPLREEREPADALDQEEGGLARTNSAHNQLQRLERSLRKFIDTQMTKAFGADWPKHRLPNGMFEKWRDKRQTTEQAGAEDRPLVEYADFTDYEPLICRRDNWREVFGAFFNRQESLRESLQRLYPIRLDTMHARLITQDDELFLRVEIKRLVKVIVR